MADVYTDKKDENNITKEKTSSEQEDNKVKGEDSPSSDDPSPGYDGISPPNPFGPRPALKTDVVSTSGHNPSNAHPVYLAPSKLASGSVFSKSQHQGNSDDNPGHKPSILAPSKFDLLNQTESSSQSKYLLRPSPLSFCVQNMKKETDVKDKEKENQESGESEKHSSDVEVKKDSDKESKFSVKTDCDKSSVSEIKVVHENYFAAALAKSEDSKEESKTDAGDDSGQFIFGEKLNERVIGVSKSPEKNKEEGFVFGQNLADRVVKADASTSENEEGAKSLSPSDKALTLEESAREFQAKNEKRVDYKEVDVITGEEGESNVLQATGKLFVFEANGHNWIERGRGLLRLNDLRTPSRTEFQSRLVMRTHGCLRVILNTKIWPGMTIERASSKSVRITATDGDEGIKVFLITTSPKDSENLLRAVDWRIQQLRVREDPDDKPNATEKRKAESDDSLPDSAAKKSRASDDQSSVTLPSMASAKREESDGSVIGPETDASSSSSTSSLILKSESD